MNQNNQNDGRGARAFKVAASISFPRLTGSTGERVARERVMQAFQSAGLFASQEIFFCTDFAISVAARWAMVPTGVLVLAAAILLKVSLPIPALAVALVSFVPSLWMASRAETGFNRAGGKVKYQCANVTGRTENEPNTGPVIVLMAHYDSKSQRFPIWLRIVLFIACAFLAIALVVLISACAVINLLSIECVFAPILLPAAATLFILSLTFLLNTVGNVSDGALDNATGVGIIIEVAKRLMDEAPGGVRLRVVATAAEEIGLCGANAYLDAHRDELTPAETVIINFDGCGADRSVGVLTSYGIPAKKVRPDIMAQIKSIAAERSIPLRFSRIPVGMATDCMPFRKAGYPGVDFIGMAGKSHTTGDRIDLLREQALADYVTMGCELAKRLAKQTR